MTQQTGYKKDLVGQYILKDPASTLTYEVDWTDWMPTGDTISSSSFAVSTVSGDTAAMSISLSGRVPSTERVYAKITGGSAGNTYTITNTVITDGGSTDVRRFRIKVEERYL